MDIDNHIPKYISEIVETFHKSNCDIYLVGGATRNIILGIDCIDYDMATSATPDQIQHMFSKTIKTGKAFGTITVLTKGKKTEITTLRTEGNYSDIRHPSKVEYITDINTDLSRRDFTINAIAYDFKKGTLIDPFHGINDIQNKTIKCVNNPTERMAEDSLRIFRAARFASQLNFSVEKETDSAIKKMSPTIKLPAMERVNKELILTLSANNKTGLKLLLQWGLLSRIIKISELTLEGLTTSLPTNYDYRQSISYLLQNQKGEAITNILKNLKFSRKDCTLIKALSENNFDYEQSLLTTKNLALSGQDIINLGFTGKAIGAIQRKLLKKIKDKEIKNDTASLIGEISKNY